MSYVTRALRGSAAVGLAACLAACDLKHLSSEERHDAIRRAAVWTPTDVSAMNIRAGPQISKGFAPDQPPGAGIDEWVNAFKEKRKEIAERRSA